jgi:hypothetical protein
MAPFLHLAANNHALPVTTLALNSMSPLLGGKSERAVDDHAQQLAQYAVGEIGAKTNVADLSLVRVSKLSTQVVAGIKYYFELETKDKAGATRHYEAQVWEKPVSARGPPLTSGVLVTAAGVEATSRGGGLCTMLGLSAWMRCTCSVVFTAAGTLCEPVGGAPIMTGASLEEAGAQHRSSRSDFARSPLYVSPCSTNRVDTTTGPTWSCSTTRRPLRWGA